MSNSQFALRPIDGGKSTILPLGTTSIGRGPLLSVCISYLMYKRKSDLDSSFLWIENPISRSVDKNKLTWGIISLYLYM